MTLTLQILNHKRDLVKQTRFMPEITVLKPVLEHYPLITESWL